MKKYFICGFHEEWGAKHKTKTLFGPILTKKERKKIRASICARFSSEEGYQEIYEITVYAIDVKDGVKEMDLGRQFQVGSWGWDAALCDPWDKPYSFNHIIETNFCRLYDNYEEAIATIASLVRG